MENRVYDFFNQTKQAFSSCSDLEKIYFTVLNRSAVAIYLDDMTDKNLLSESLIKPLSLLENVPDPIDAVQNHTFCATPKTYTDINQAFDALAAGDVVIKVDSVPEIFCFSVRFYNVRSIAEPPTSSILRGPREGFVEDLKTNISLIRRRLRTKDLVITNVKVGKYSSTEVSVVYLNGVADNTLVNKLLDKIRSISIDGVTDSAYIARFLEEKRLSVFKQVGNTEKPDILCAKLLEGRIGIVVDGSPMVLTVPYVLFEAFQDSQDYYKKSSLTIFTRIIRLLGAFIAVTLPAGYVALQQYQYQIIPFKLLLTVARLTSGIPFTPTMEMICVLLIFEVLNEASIRMPRYVGMALSIVGAIVLGETAVNAGLVSSPAVLVVALSATGLYCVPDEVNAFALIRFLLVPIAGVLGLYGILLAAISLFAYITNLDSFSTPFLAPIAPFNPADMQDGLLKADLTEMKYRPSIFRQKNKKRQ